MTDHRKPVRLAHQALLAAIDCKWPTVGRTLERLNAECDSNGLALALIAWCDAFAEHAHGGMTGFQQVRIAAWNTDTGEVGDPPRESVRWATRLIQERARGDQDGFSALLDEMNTLDGFERGRYVLELIESVALTIRTTPRGYAVAGKATS